MTKKRFLVGLLAIALIFGMTVLGCEEEEPEPEDDRPMGPEWTMVSPSPFARETSDIAFGNGKFIAVGSHDIGSSASRVASSTDGVNWSLIENTPAGFVPQAIAYGNDRWVTNNGYSTDGTSWTLVDWTGVLDYSKIVYGNQKFVAIGSQNKIACSTDGTSWTELQNLPFSGNSESIYGIAFGGGKFVAVGGSNSAGKIATSTDGETWTTVSPTVFNSGNFKSINCIAYGGGKFVASNSKATAYSSDGTNWTPIIREKENGTTYSAFFLEDFSCLAYGNGKWIGLKGTSMMGYSSDGITWTPALNPPNITFPGGAIYGNGKFVAYSRSSSAGAQMAYSNQ